VNPVIFTEKEMPKEIWLCERKSHLPEYDGATGYFYYEPIRPYADQVPAQDDVREAVETTKRFLRIIKLHPDWRRAIETLIRAAQQQPECLPARVKEALQEYHKLKEGK
jgi:hypothetical protein